jgi:hypothetical protein
MTDNYGTIVVGARCGGDVRAALCTVNREIARDVKRPNVIACCKASTVVSSSSKILVAGESSP